MMNMWLFGLFRKPNNNNIKRKRRHLSNYIKKMKYDERHLHELARIKTMHDKRIIGDL
jgi:hypothetical protein